MKYNIGYLKQGLSTRSSFDLNQSLCYRALREDLYEPLRASGGWLGKYLPERRMFCTKNYRDKWNICFVSNIFFPKSYGFEESLTKRESVRQSFYAAFLTPPKTYIKRGLSHFLVSVETEVLRRFSSKRLHVHQIHLFINLRWGREREWDVNSFVTYIMLGWYSTVVLRFASLISNDSITIYNSRTAGLAMRTLSVHVLHVR